MANIDKVKLGGNSPSALMHGGLIPNPDDYKFNFTQWSINESALIDYEIDCNKLAIKKFKPNCWLIKSTLTLAKGDICELTRNLSFTVRGLELYKSTIFDTFYTHLSTVWGSNGTTPAGKGLLVMPWCTNGNAAAQPEFPWSSYVWDSFYINGVSTSTFRPSNAAKVGDDPILRGNSDWGYDSYAHTNDGLIQFLPDWTSFGCPWDSWNLSISLFTGNEDVIDESGFITLDDPIVIIQLNDVNYDPTNEECWNLYMGNTQVYHKEKTVENALIKYGLAHMRGNELIIDAASAKSYGKYRIDPLDVANYLATGVRLNCKPVNSDIADLLTLYVSNNYLPPSRLQCYNDERDTGIYSGSNVRSATLKVALNDPESKQYMTLACPFSDSEVHSATINVGDGCRISSTQRMFYHAGQLTEILFNGTPCGATDCSGMFEGASKITEYPANLINWDARGSHKSSTNPSVTWEDSHMAWFCDYASSMRYIVNSTVGNNIIQIGSNCYAMFRGCSDLLQIDPVLDFKYVNPDATHLGESAAYKCLDCPKLSTVQIKNLNHGDWDFANGIHGNLSQLNSDSVAYMINNLVDLTAANTVQEGHPAYRTKTSATLTLPKALSDSGKVTDNMKTSALSKGWTIVFKQN